MSHSFSGGPVEPDDPSGAGSTGDLLGRLTEQTSTLIRSELALAQLEIKDSAKRAGKGAGLLGAAGVLGFYGLGVLIATAVIALALLLAWWLAALIVAVVLLLAAAIVGLMGKKQVTRATPLMERTTRSVKRDVAEVQESRQA